MTDDTSGSGPSTAADGATSAGEGRRRRFPDRIFAVASPPSAGGVSLFTPGRVVSTESIGGFVSSDSDVLQAAEALRDAGFEVLQVNPLFINIAGPVEAFERAFGVHLFTEERPVVKPGSVRSEATFIDCEDSAVSGLIETVGSPFESLLEGVAIEEPYYLHAPLPLPPVVGYWHLNVPDDVAVGLNAARPHRSGTTGLGLRVAMVDTGFQAHPFFADHGYRVEPTVLGPGTADPEVDENGHGTGESANIFATAPDITLLPVKTATASGALVNVTAAFAAAAGLSPDVITNSWGSNQQDGPLSAANQALAAAVAGAVASGVVVVFSAGNGSWGFPGQHPDVLSVGGVHQRPDGTLEASDYTSGFLSNVYPGRRVPDVSGLVGMRPRAMYIMLPLPSGCAIDQGNGGGSHPDGDETPADDGWAAFSGTSASAPQVAGVVALLLQACPGLTPEQVRDLLMQTARDVTTGTNHPNFGNPATVGPDTATGDGLVDAHRAVLLAKLRCVAPEPPPAVSQRQSWRPFRSSTPPDPREHPPFSWSGAPFVPPAAPPLPPPLGPAGVQAPRAGRSGGSLSSEDVAELVRLVIESDDPPRP